MLEGMLVDLTNNKENERKYFLLNDMMLLARPIKTKADLAIQWKLKDEISLKRTVVRDVPDSDCTNSLSRSLCCVLSHLILSDPQCV